MRKVIAFLAKHGVPHDRLECGHVVLCSFDGATDPHNERCHECER